MSAIAHAPAHAWAGTHRAFLFVVMLTVLALAAVTVAVVLMTGDDTAGATLAPERAERRGRLPERPGPHRLLIEAAPSATLTPSRRALPPAPSALTIELPNARPS